MQIIDREGKTFEITDLCLAIGQADYYRGLVAVHPKDRDFVAERAAYWQDFYDKLMAIKRDRDGTAKI